MKYIYKWLLVLSFLAMMTLAIGCAATDETINVTDDIDDAVSDLTDVVGDAANATGEVVGNADDAVSGKTEAIGESGDAIGDLDDDYANFVLITIWDNDVTQGFVPQRYTTTAGRFIELRIANADYRPLINENGENTHSISISGPGVGDEVLELEPGDAASIKFTTRKGEISLSCTNPTCDLHSKLIGKITIID